MAGQYPGPFGPPPGGAVTGGIPGAASAAPGRFGVPVRVLCALAPLLTAGLLGAVPSLVLAIRRRRPYDVVGAVVYCALFLTMIVCAGIAGSLKASAADVVGQVALGLLWLTPSLHFLLMDRRPLWEPTAPAAPTFSPYASTMPGHITPPPAAPPAAPPAVPPAAPPTAPPADDLRELGELLRRQAREGRT
ncbi:hypothetical protein [Kitasatospora aureofaciens]|uniref:hypothetical protein n=1 Tax=Kitasatospora aureofaciens TaxID=1894 RepID=UPI003819BCEA